MSEPSPPIHQTASAGHAVGAALSAPPTIPAPPSAVLLDPPAAASPWPHDGADRHFPVGLEARPGHLVPWARVAHVLVWLGCCVGLGMIARSVVVTGLGTWWIPNSNRPGALAIVPFLVPIGMIVLVLSYWRWIPITGVAASLVLGLVALGDVSRVKGLAVVEAGLAGCALIVSLASFFGRYRSRTSLDS